MFNLLNWQLLQYFSYMHRILLMSVLFIHSGQIESIAREEEWPHSCQHCGSSTPCIPCVLSSESVGLVSSRPFRSRRCQCAAAAHSVSWLLICQVNKVTRGHNPATHCILFCGSICQNLLLQLLHALFPYLIQLKSVDEDTKDVSNTFFKDLTSLVDKLHSSEKPTEQLMVRVARQVIIDG